MVYDEGSKEVRGLGRRGRSLLKSGTRRGTWGTAGLYFVVPALLCRLLPPLAFTCA
jgi:hypothetical protein